jgi:O-methyltransferase
MFFKKYFEKDNTINKSEKVIFDYSQSDFTTLENQIFDQIKPFTMTSKERVISLIRAVHYLIENNIEGDFVECGVWKGGSAMAIIKTLQFLGVNDRKVYLYDTFEGMPPPEEVDKSFNNEFADVLLKKDESYKDTSVVWAYSSLEDVKKNIFSLGYDINLVHFIKGKVEDTLPLSNHEMISLLRLDTDWYASTKVEMEVLFPKLSKAGVLIIDDYGHWQGAKKAIDEYLKDNKIPLFLSRIDYTGRLAIKI